MYTDTMPDLAVPEGMDNDTLERVLVLCEESWNEYPAYGFGVVGDLMATYGQAGLALIGSIVCRQFAEMCAPNPEPSSDWAKARAARYLAEGKQDKALREMKYHRMELARYHGQVVLRCDGCGRYRHGTEWRRAAAPPADWLVMVGATCPDCDWSDGESAQRNPEADEAEFAAWLTGEVADAAEGGAA